MTPLADLAREPEERVVLALVDEIVGPLLDGQRASAEFTPASESGGTPAELDITPAKSTAAEIHLAFDAPRELYVTLGRHETHFEVVERSDEAFEQTIREILEGVVGGRYRERVKVRDDGELRAAEGIVETPGGRPRRISFGAPLVEGPADWREASYDAY